MGGTARKLIGVCVCVWKETDGCKVEGWWVDAESWRVKAGRAEVVREGWGWVGGGRQRE